MAGSATVKRKKEIESDWEWLWERLRDWERDWEILRVIEREREKKKKKKREREICGWLSEVTLNDYCNYLDT